MKKIKQKGIAATEVMCIISIFAVIGLIVGALNYFTPDETNPDTYVTICLGNHEYWRAGIDYGKVLAPKFTDAGLPVLCGKVDEK